MKTERLTRYESLAVDLEPLSQALVNEQHLDDLILESALESPELFTKILTVYREDKEKLEGWLWQLLATRHCPPFAIHEIIRIDGSLIQKTNPETLEHALHFAVRQSNKGLLKFLLFNDATKYLSAYQKNKDGYSVIDLAKQSPSLTRLLTRAGYNTSDLISDHFNSSPKKKYIIFSGGGVKAIAFQAALKEYVSARLCSLEQIKGYAGSSAGAIAATVFALGYSLDEIDQVLTSFDLAELLDYDEGFDLSQLQSIRSIGNDLKTKGLNKASIASLAWSWLTGSQELKNIQKLFELITQNRGGVCKGEKIAAWFAQIIQNKLKGSRFEKTNPHQITFEDLKSLVDQNGKPLFKDLRIATVNFNTGCHEILCAERTPDVTIVSALCASTAIPLVFKLAKLTYRVQSSDGQIDYIESSETYIDASSGINYPFYAFRDKDPNSTQSYGFYLAEEEQTEQLKHGHSLNKPFVFKKEDPTSILKKILNFIFYPQNTPFEDKKVRDNTLFIFILESLSFLDFGNKQAHIALKKLGQKSALDKIALKKSYLPFQLSPGTIKKLSKLGCIHYDGYGHHIETNQTYINRAQKKSIALEILKIYARATEEELPHLKQIINPNLADPSGLTALHIAYTLGLTEEVKKLRLANADNDALWQSSSSEEKIPAKKCNTTNHYSEEICHLINIHQDFIQRIQKNKKDRLKLIKENMENSHARLEHEATELESERNNQRTFINSLIKSNTNETNEQLEKIFRQCIEQADHEKMRLKQILSEHEEQIATLQNNVSQYQNTVQKKNEQLESLQYQRGQSDTNCATAQKKSLELQEQLTKERDALKKSQSTAQTLENERDLLKQTIQNTQKELATRKQAYSDNPINRLKWRQTHNHFAQQLLPQLNTLIHDLETEVARIHRLRHKNVMKLLLPILVFCFYIKEKIKVCKLRGLRTIAQKLREDNSHSAKQIIESSYLTCPELRLGLFSRSSRLLDQIVATETSHCNYSLD